MYSIKSSLKFDYSLKQSQYLYLIPHVSYFLSLLDRLLTRFDNELAINVALSINCKISDIFFVISSPFLPIFVTSFSIGT